MVTNGHLNIHGCTLQSPCMAVRGTNECAQVQIKTQTIQIQITVTDPMNDHKSGGCGFPLHLGSRIRAKLNSQELKIHLLVHGRILHTKYWQWL